MPTSILDLPYDIDHQIAGHLNIRDYTSLSRSSWQFCRHLQDERTAKNAVQSSIPFSKTGRQALQIQECPSFRSTVSTVYDRNEALRTARPYSASVLAYASSFCWEDGILAYSTDTEIRILDLNDAFRVEKVISGTFLGGQIAKPGQSLSQGLAAPRTLSVFGHGHGIVIIMCDFGPVQGQYLFAVNVAEQRVLLQQRLRSTCKLFVRHNAHHLYYGTHSAVGSHGHHEWLIQGFTLDTGQPLTQQPLQLRALVGSEIGATVCFAIHKGFFYALTNQTSFEAEEVDWTSYYHYIRMPLDSTGDTPDLVIRTIFRRQHLEGPINDAWSDLSFQTDDATGALLVVECRKEWLGGASSAVRTYYTEPFAGAVHGNWDDRVTFPPDDPLARLIGSSDNSRWERTPRRRLERYVHREFETTAGKAKAQAMEYLRVKTKWNGYTFNANDGAGAFVDLVVEDYILPGEWRARERMRLRVVSRLPMSPRLNVDADAPEPERVRTSDSQDRDVVAVAAAAAAADVPVAEVVVVDSEIEYTDSDVWLWPDPADAALPSDIETALNDILCPGGKAGEVKASLGETGLVYTAGPPCQNRRCRALVYISFDPHWGFEGMRRLDGSPAQPKAKHEYVPEGKRREDDDEERKRKLGDTSGWPNKRRCKLEADVDVEIDGGEQQQQQQQVEGSLASSASASASASAPAQGFVREEPASYLSIASGFWLR